MGGTGCIIHASALYGGHLNVMWGAREEEQAPLRATAACPDLAHSQVHRKSRLVLQASKFRLYKTNLAHASAGEGAEYSSTETTWISDQHATGLDPDCRAYVVKAVQVPSPAGCQLIGG
eukprot:1158760-Pelagomonas_calceolata.AAC.7